MSKPGFTINIVNPHWHCLAHLGIQVGQQVVGEHGETAFTVHLHRGWGHKTDQGSLRGIRGGANP
eukprot:1157837-Pelagomonas_calceolata.AAC.12